MSTGPHWSERFQRRVWLDVIETGTLRESGQGHCWIWKAVEGRDDNLLCVAALLADVLIVKTVMHRFAPEDT